MKKIIFLSLILGCLAGIAGFAQEMKEYQNDELGFKIKHPAGWYLDERDNQVDFFTREDAFESDASGAGITILVQPVPPDAGDDPAKLFEKLADEMGMDFEFTRAFTRVIGDEDWYAVPFSSQEENAAGEVCLKINDGSLYVLGLFFKMSEAQGEFVATIDRMLESFRFTSLSYERYTSDKKGVSFEHPTRSRIMEQSDVIMVPWCGDDTDFSDPGAAIVIGVLPPDAWDNQDLDDNGIAEYLLSEANGMEIILHPVPATIRGKAWIKTEAIQEESKIRLYLRREFDVVFVIMFVWNPIDAEETYDVFFTRFRDSLTLDLEKWATSAKENQDHDDYYDDYDDYDDYDYDEDEYYCE